MILFTGILASCFVWLSHKCGGCLGLGEVVRWLWDPPQRRLSDKWGDGGWLHGSWGRRPKWCEGMAPGTSREHHYKECLSVAAPAESPSPTAQGKVAAQWGAACMCQRWPWLQVPHQALGFTAGGCGSTGKVSCFFLCFCFVPQAQCNPFSCGATGGCCPVLMLLSTAADSGKISQSGI